MIIFDVLPENAFRAYISEEWGDMQADDPIWLAPLGAGQTGLALYDSDKQLVSSYWCSMSDENVYWYRA